MDVREIDKYFSSVCTKDINMDVRRFGVDNNDEECPDFRRQSAGGPQTPIGPIQHNFYHKNKINSRLESGSEVSSDP